MAQVKSNKIKEERQKRIIITMSNDVMIDE
jgi:hypothetical protein